MKCACPKCSASIEIEEPSSPDKGNFTTCPECQAKFWLHRESFALRAYKKDWKVFCQACGGELGPDTFCPSCFVQCPDYWVVQAGKPARRKIEKPKRSLSLSRPRPWRSKAEPKAAATGEAVTASPSNKKLLIALAVLVVLVVFGSVGANVYLKQQRLSEFSDNYVQALYGVKSGTDLIFIKLGDMAASGKPLSQKEVNLLAKVKAKIDQAQARLQPTPEDYARATGSLAAAYQVYADLYQLSTTASGGAPDFASRVDGLKKALAEAEGNLRQDVPPPLKENIRKVVVKYRNLKFMVE